jgi:AIPR protein
MRTRTNDQTILDKIVQQRLKDAETDLTLEDYFEIISASEILKNQHLSFEEIEGGIVGGGNDGGIDAIYTFLNGELLNEDTLLNQNQKKNLIEVHIIQSKKSGSFGEDAISKFKETSEDLFNLSSDISTFTKRYNAELIERVNWFRDAYSALASSFPNLTLSYYYVTEGTEIHPNVRAKVAKLQKCIVGLFSESHFSFAFIGASDLLRMLRSTPQTARILQVDETPIVATKGSYIALVTLSRFFDFLTDNRVLAKNVFESNVRDYQGSVVVNSNIQKTLCDENSDDFWYLNNGVTIITPKAVLAGKQLTIEDPQIVNGLQTSQEIFKYFTSDSPSLSDRRSLLVRVICEQDSAARDRIIRATNSQTVMPPAALRSSDEIHRNIEDFLKVNGYFYDRKKNFYKNSGKPSSRIVSINYVAQAFISVVLLQPNQARGRPSTLINSDSEYAKIFSLNVRIDAYLKVVQLMKFVEKNLKELSFERKVITNIKHYVAMQYAVNLAGEASKIAEMLVSSQNFLLDEKLLKTVANNVAKTFERLGGTDQVAKGNKLIEVLLRNPRKRATRNKDEGHA